MTKQTYTLNVNGETRRVVAAPDTPLLWVIRDLVGLKATKYGCGIGVCGACTVKIDGYTARSCTMPIGDMAGDEAIQTLEGFVADNPDHPVLAAWKALDVPQCGYCQPGQIMAAAAFVADNPDPSDEDIRASMANYCRCGTYTQIAAAIGAAAREKAEG